MGFLHIDGVLMTRLHKAVKLVVRSEQKISRSINISCGNNEVRVLVVLL